MKEDKIINDYLTPVLSELMAKSLSSILEMKHANSINKEDTDVINFISKFLEEAELFYSNMKDVRNLASINDLKQYILELTV